MLSQQKILIIRFSSFGDIVQASSVCPALKRRFPEGSIHWITRSDMSGFLSCVPDIEKIWSLDRKLGLKGLIDLGLLLRSEKFTHIYDAHRNLRSFLLCFILRFLRDTEFCYRSKERWKRFCLFVLRINNFPKPYRGMISFLTPLKKWGLTTDFDFIQSWNFEPAVMEKVDQFVEPSDVVIVPSAAWEMKRWPLEHWKQLIKISPQHHFVVLGGPQDTFCDELVALAPERVKNLAGKLSLVESCYAVQRSAYLLSADTGLLHVADILGKKGVAIIGPTAFGFPTSPLIEIVEVDLACRPCTKDGRGGCSQNIYKKCMIDITPERVAKFI